MNSNILSSVLDLDGYIAMGDLPKLAEGERMILKNVTSPKGRLARPERRENLAKDMRAIGFHATGDPLKSKNSKTIWQAFRAA